MLEGIRILPLLLGAKARLLDEPAEKTKGTVNIPLQRNQADLKQDQKCRSEELPIRALAGRDCVPCGVVLLEDLDKSLEWLWSGPVRSRL